MIIQSAILKDGIIHTGKRHHDIFNAAKPFGSLRGGVQGFVTDEGKFLDRKEAVKYAFEHGQIPELKRRLYSEDLW